MAAQDVHFLHFIVSLHVCYRTNNTLLSLYQRIILGTQKRDGHQRACLAWFSRMVFRERRQVA